MTQVADSVIPQLTALLDEIQGLKVVTQDSEAVCSLARAADNVLRAAYWLRRNDRAKGGRASSAPSAEDKAVADRIYDAALTALEDEATSRVDASYALTLTSAIQYARYDDEFDCAADRRLFAATDAVWRRGAIEEWGQERFVRLCRNTLVSAAMDDDDETAAQTTREVLSTLRSMPLDSPESTRNMRSGLIEALLMPFHRVERTARDSTGCDAVWDAALQHPLFAGELEDGNQAVRIGIGCSVIAAWQKIAPGRTAEVWEAIATWAGHAAWDAKGLKDFDPSRLVLAAFNDQHTSAPLIDAALSRVVEASGGFDEDGSALPEHLALCMTAWLPQVESTPWPAAQPLVNVMCKAALAGGQEAVRNHSLAQGLACIWTQLAIDGRLDAALESLAQSWALAGQAKNACLRSAVYCAVASLSLAPGVGPAEAERMADWVQAPRANNATRSEDDARIAAIEALCLRLELGISPARFIDPHSLPPP